MKLHFEPSIGYCGPGLPERERWTLSARTELRLLQVTYATVYGSTFHSCRLAESSRISRTYPIGQGLDPPFVEAPRKARPADPKSAKSREKSRAAAGGRRRGW
jgi:hypothetical protein